MIPEFAACVLKSSLLSFALLLSQGAFAQVQCGGDWITALSHDIFNTPYRVSVIDNSAREVSPGYWVSDNPKGGNLYITFGQPVGQTFITRPPFSIENALILNPLLEQWRADNQPYSFRFKMDVRWSMRALPAYVPALDWVPGQRDFTSPVQKQCGADGNRWKDVNGNDWRTKAQESKGPDGYKKWISTWSGRYNRGTIQNADVNRWYTLTDAYTVDFDPWICNTHLGAGIQVKEFRELYIDDWKFMTYMAADPSASNPCK